MSDSLLVKGVSGKTVERKVKSPIDFHCFGVEELPPVKNKLDLNKSKIRPEMKILE